MKFLSFAFAVLLCVPCLSVAIESKVQSIKQVSVITSDQQGEQLAKHIGIRLSKPYSMTRLKLIKLSWQPDTAWGLSGANKSLSFQAYPEILCGNGIDAICTARFNKNGNIVILTIDQNKKLLPVVHVEQD